MLVPGCMIGVESGIILESSPRDPWLDFHWVFLDSTCRSRRVQAAICPRTLKASKVCNCTQKQAVGPSIFRWAKVVCFRWAKVFVWWDLFTFCRMLLWKWRFWKSKITIGDPWASQNQVARNWFASAHRQHACMHLNIFCAEPQLAECDAHILSGNISKLLRGQFLINRAPLFVILLL